MAMPRLGGGICYAGGMRNGGDSAALIATLRDIVGRKGVVVNPRKTERFRTGIRFGKGDALAVVRPRTLVEMWRVTQAAVAARKILIFQAANTGVTGGSTPWGEYDRDVIIVSTLALKGIHLLNGGKQIIAMPGSTLHRLERILRPLGRTPHSETGSACIGASIIGGVCNNSGGALVQRGPAYTEFALFAQVTEDGELKLVNHLGLDLGSEPEEILRRLEQGDFNTKTTPPTGGQASDGEYKTWVRDVASDKPARYNADPRRLNDAAGCAGRLAIFAVRLDTFAGDEQEQVFHVVSNSAADFTELRRRLLRDCTTLPILAEYLSGQTFRLAERYGKDSYLTIRWLGTDFLPQFFAAKWRFDGFAKRFSFLPSQLSDRVLQALSRLFLPYLPRRLRALRGYQHHLTIKSGGDNIAETRQVLEALAQSDDTGLRFLTCTKKEGKAAMLHRYVMFSIGPRYLLMHPKRAGSEITLDVALPRNAEDWDKVYPDAVEGDVFCTLTAAHFLCHVFHWSLLLHPERDTAAVREKILQSFDKRGAEYPAEHNVGHLYEAKPVLKAFYETLDPTRTFNPGIGGTPKQRAMASASTTPYAS